MVKIGRQKNRPNTLVSPAPVGWRTLAEKVYYSVSNPVNSRQAPQDIRSREFQAITELGDFSQEAIRPAGSLTCLSDYLQQLSESITPWRSLDLTTQSIFLPCTVNLGRET